MKGQHLCKPECPAHVRLDCILHRIWVIYRVVLQHLKITKKKKTPRVNSKSQFN